MPLSSVSITPDNPSILIGECIYFIATPEGGVPSAYQWNVDGSNVSGANQSTFIYQPSTVGEHKVKCYALDGENPVSETETVTVASLYSLAYYLSIIAKAVE